MQHTRLLVWALLGASASGSVYADNDAAQRALGKQLFTQTATPPCALCHTLKDAAAEGAVGPVLDELQPNAQRVATAVRNGIGQMPSFKDSLSEAQIQALARYVAQASGGAPAKP